MVKGKLEGISVVVAAFEFRFLGGSMGSVVGEKFVQGINTAIKEKVPFVCFATSGGARMQESMISLMQMAKTSAAIQKLKKEKFTKENKIEFNHSEFGEVQIKDMPRIKKIAAPHLVNSWTTIPHVTHHDEAAVSYTHLTLPTKRIV